MLLEHLSDGEIIELVRPHWQQLEAINNGDIEDQFIFDHGLHRWGFRVDDSFVKVMSPKCLRAMSYVNDIEFELAGGLRDVVMKPFAIPKMRRVISDEFGSIIATEFLPMAENRDNTENWYYSDQGGSMIMALESDLGISDMHEGNVCLVGDVVYITDLGETYCDTADVIHRAKKIAELFDSYEEYLAR